MFVKNRTSLAISFAEIKSKTTIDLQYHVVIMNVQLRYRFTPTTLRVVVVISRLEGVDHLVELVRILCGVELVSVCAGTICYPVINIVHAVG